MIVRSGGHEFDSPFDSDEEAREILRSADSPAAKAIARVPNWRHDVQYHAHRLAYRFDTRSVKLDGFDGVLSLLCGAARHVPSPEIMLERDDWGVHVILSKDRRSARLMRNGGRQGSRIEQCIGEILDGKLLEYTPDSRVREILLELSRDLKGAIKRYGSSSGRCCFCNRELGPEGAAEGFGPKCGRAYGLTRDGKPTPEADDFDF